MRIFKLLLAAIFAVCATAWAHQPVVGIEITADGATSAISHPNGMVQAVTSVRGSQEYRQQLREWHQQCTPAHSQMRAGDAAVLAYLIAALSPTMEVANGALPAYVVTLLFFVGLLIRADDQPRYWHW